MLRRGTKIDHRFLALNLELQSDVIVDSPHLLESGKPVQVCHEIALYQYLSNSADLPTLYRPGYGVILLIQ